MKNSDIIRMAAEYQFETEGYSCNSISNVCMKEMVKGNWPNVGYDLIASYEQTFSPRETWNGTVWLFNVRWESDEELQNWRIMALLFFSEMLKEAEEGVLS